MAFSVKSDRADELLRDLTGEGITEAVTRALDERLSRTVYLSDSTPDRR